MSTRQGCAKRSSTRMPISSRRTTAMSCASPAATRRARSSSTTSSTRNQLSCARHQLAPAVDGRGRLFGHANADCEPEGPARLSGRGRCATGRGAPAAIPAQILDRKGIAEWPAELGALPKDYRNCPACFPMASPRDEPSADAARRAGGKFTNLLSWWARQGSNL
jgi:hypothetical protein